MAPKFSGRASAYAKVKAKVKSKSGPKSNQSQGQSQSNTSAEPKQLRAEESSPGASTSLTPSEHVAHGTASEASLSASLKSKFQQLDTDGDGQLSFTEIRGLLQKGNPCMSIDEIRTIFDAVDADKNGSVSFNEFVDYLFSPVCVDAMPRKPSTTVDAVSAEHVAALQKEFPFKCHIELTEHRAITVPQLERVVKYAHSHCEDWVDKFPVDVSRTSGQVISMEWANLYHISFWIIKPATMRADCAFVELLACEPQVPSWFISHWWGEAICAFLRCVQKHSEMRDLTSDAPYWVCAYANRQHSLDEDIAMDPKSTSFYKALMLAAGVLLILDDKTAHSGPATPFGRIWCLFEQASALEDESKILDIAAHNHDAAQLLTDGVVSDDSRFGEGRQLSRKAAREGLFPIEVMKAGFHVQIENGNASVPGDRIHILNSICSRPLDATPVIEHEKYTRVNTRLSALFAIAAFPRAASNNLVDELQLFDKINADRWRKHLSINAWGWQGLEDTRALTSSAVLGRCNLIDLHIEMTACSNLVSVDDLGHGLVDLSSLRTLRLEMSGCDRVTTVQSIGVGLVSLKTLEHLTVNLNRCFQVGDADTLFPCIANLTSLKTCKVRVGYLDKLRVVTFGGGALGCSELKQLILYFGYCQELESIDGMGEGLKSLAALKKVSLNLSKCPSLVGVGELSNGIACLDLLEELDLDISCSPHISDMTELGRSLKHLRSLRVLKLDLRKYQCVPMDEIGASIASLVALQEFFLDLTDCDELISINELAKSLASLACLSSLTLRLGGCRNLASIEELGIGCAGLPALKTFCLNLQGCRILPSSIAKVWVEQDTFIEAAKGVSHEG